MAVFSHSDCIERLGKWVHDANTKKSDSSARDAWLRVNDRVIVESNFFNYADIQLFYYTLTRTSCEWWIYPAEGNRVQLRVRLF